MILLQRSPLSLCQSRSTVSDPIYYADLFTGSAELLKNHPKTSQQDSHLAPCEDRLPALRSLPEYFLPSTPLTSNKFKILCCHGSEMLALLGLVATTDAGRRSS
jgi:hypothetical protein